MPSRHANRGFTLMEILVAFVVLATAVAVLYQTFSTNIRNVDAISGYAQAIAIAESKIGSVGLEAPMEEGETSGETEDRRFKWTISVVKYVPPSSAEAPNQFFNANDLMRATVTVVWDDTGQQSRTISLSTLRLYGRRS